MDKKVYLLDYNGEQHEEIIRDFEKVKYCYIKILSGDWVLTVIKNDNTKEIYDTGKYSGGRIINFYDGTYYINPNRIDELKNFKENYDLKEDLL